MTEEQQKLFDMLDDAQKYAEKHGFDLITVSDCGDNITALRYCKPEKAIALAEMFKLNLMYELMVGNEQTRI